MSRFDDLWFLADEANQRAERAYHRLCDRYEGFTEVSATRRVSRSRFETLARRVRATGAPYGAQTLVRSDGRVVLVRHDHVDKWVLPGGEVHGDETYREAAERELAEEAGADAVYEGLGVLTRIDIRCDDHATWGVLPVFVARATSAALAVSDPDGEISDAGWFPVDDLPAETRDRALVRRWFERE